MTSRIPNLLRMILLVSGATLLSSCGNPKPAVVSRPAAGSSSRGDGTSHSAVSQPSEGTSPGQEISSGEESGVSSSPSFNTTPDHSSSSRLENPTTASRTQSVTTVPAASSTSPALSSTAPAPQPTASHSIPLTDSRIRYNGRVAVKEGAAYIDWSCSGLEINVQGGDVRVQLTAAAQNDLQCTYIGVYVNGRRTAKVRLATGTQWYTLANHLDAGAVTNIKIVKLNEASLSSFTVKELEVTGTLAAKTPDKSRRIQWIGDSITAGYGILSPNAAAPFKAETEDGTLTYAAKISQALDADFHVVAASGYGVALDNSGGSSALIPPLYGYTQWFRDRTTKWDCSRFQPDLVVVNLGTNDVAGGAKADVLKSGVTGFLQQLRQAHPQAQIVWVYGMMINVREAEIRAAVESFAAGDSKVHYLSLPLQNTSADGAGSGGHPSVKTNQKVADNLAPRLQSLMGW